MSIKVVALGDGLQRHLIPVNHDDYKKLAKIPNGKEIEITIIARRDHATNSKLWAIVQFFFANRPEHLDMIKSADEMYQWLKLRIGFVTVVGAGEYIYTLPRSTAFTDLKDENEYIEKMHIPAMEFMAREGGYASVIDLEDTSKAWHKVKHDHTMGGV